MTIVNNRKVSLSPRKYGASRAMRNVSPPSGKSEDPKQKGFFNRPRKGGKSYWDWMQLLIIPFVLTVGGLLFSTYQHNTDQQRALDQQQATILQTYFDNIQDLLLNHNLLKSQPDGDVAVLARARTLTALQGLDPKRKGLLVQFICDAGLIGCTLFPNCVLCIKETQKIIDLHNADLSRADLHNTNLDNAGLSGANLSEANLSHVFLDEADLSDAQLTDAQLTDAQLTDATLSHADLSGADLSTVSDTPFSVTNLNGTDFSRADLNGANLSGTELMQANLREADLSGANFSRTRLSGADFSGANLRGTDLRGAYLGPDLDAGGAVIFSDAKLTQGQLDQVSDCKGATLPKGLICHHN
jgi:uncharacterized protein YjbI with pentapeptide repeats